MSARDEYENPNNYVHWYDGRTCVDKAVADAALAEAAANCEAMEGLADHVIALQKQKIAQLKEAGDALFHRYVDLVESGDAGFWDWHDEEECQRWQEVSNEG
jgi:hypothetical protein